MNQRKSGLLLAVSSLPSRWGIGDLGPGAGWFIETLSSTLQKYWQVLPLTVTDNAMGNSPYNSPSAFGGNPLYISPELMLKEGLVEPEDLLDVPPFSREEINYSLVTEWKEGIFRKSFRRFTSREMDRSEKFLQFCSDNSYWLDDFALFFALKKHLSGRPWYEWPKEYKTRDQKSLAEFALEKSEETGFHKFLQYVFHQQWEKIRFRCIEKGIHILGDMPIYVSHDSVDVWANQEIFQLDSDGIPHEVSGVPPDYFSETGQLWGNPLYDWEALSRTDFSWWKDRIKRALSLYDSLRIDHFRGLVAYWAIPRGERNAIRGKWVKAPVYDLFRSLKTSLGCLPFVAEDLGIITDDVREVMEYLELPGMLVLQFCFDNFPENPYAPHNHIANRLVYTGTHDNNTVSGWFENEVSEEVKKTLTLYLGREPQKEEIPFDLIRMALFSVAETAIIPVQDLLGLGKAARMNDPSSPQGNWKWRLDRSLLTDSIIANFRELTLLSGRAR